MSTKNCNQCENPLLRDGTSQPQRFFPELDPSYVSVDERTIIDLVEFTLKYAQKIRFWELDNSTTGDWIGFIENDIATLNTIIAKKTFDEVRADFQTSLDNYKTEVAAVDATDAATYFKEMIDQTMAIVSEIDGWYNQSVDGFDLNLDLLKIIQTQAAPNTRFLAAYDQAVRTGVSVYPATPAYPDPYDTLNSIWSDFTTVVPHDFGALTDDIDKMESIVNNVVAIFESMINAQEKLANNAPAHFDQILTDYPEHEAHFALLLSFFQLFALAQNHINSMTQRHMDFYYKDVLRMEEKAAVPDKVHLVFEPAKNTASHLLEKGALFKAGKDDDGVDISFALDSNLVVNRAVVDSVKNVFALQNKNNLTDFIYAKPIADSADGLGEALEEGTGWKLFGEHQRIVKEDPLSAPIDPRTMIDGEVGLAIASPEFLLGEGERSITLELEVDTDSLNGPDGMLSLYDPVLFTTIADIGNYIKENITLQFSGESEWIVPLDPTAVVVAAGNDKIFISTKLLIEQPPVVPYSAAALGGSYQTEWPMMRVLFNQSPANLVYESFKRLKIEKFTINSDVKEVISLVVANDSGTLDPTKPFQPFGSVPEAGSNFYIGSAEVFSKRLTDLAVTIEWQGVPSTNLADYYRVYKRNASQEYIGAINNSGTVTNNGNDDFTAKLKMLDDFRWLDLVEVDTSIQVQNSTAQPLFFLFFAFLFINGTSTQNKIELFNHDGGPDGNNPQLPRTMRVNNDPIVWSSNATGANPENRTSFQLFESQLGKPYTRDVQLQKQGVSEYTTSTKRGFIKLELNGPGFLHDIYPKVQTKQAIALGKHDLIIPTVPAVPEPELPNEPYTPVVRVLAIDYKTSFTVDYTNAAFHNFDERVEQLFHVTPFGVAEIFPVDENDLQATKPAEVNTNPHLAHNYAVDAYTAEEDNAEGTLYIGIKDLLPPQGLTLFFQFDEGTENPDLEVPTVRWSYLMNNQWVYFKSTEIVSDSTNGLVNSGIIEFAIPKTATDQNTLMPAGNHWLRAQVVGDTDAFSDVLMVKAQAASATFADNGNHPYRIATPIAPETIARFVKKDFSIKTISQPYPSFGGRIAEQDNEFYARASERLRHKNRAITIRDYEHLVLEAYPEIYKVKCINHTNKVSEIAPGSVSVITIPDPSLRNDKNPFELKVSKSKLANIKAFLEDINSCFVDLDVRNPNYEKIEVSFGVEFHKEFSDRSFYVNKLSEDIKRFISPWAFGDDEEIIFGGRIDKSVILNFIEERPYVDYVDNFIMEQYVNGEPLGGDPTLAKYNGVQEAVAQTAASVLITNDTHNINDITC